MNDLKNYSIEFQGFLNAKGCKIVTITKCENYYSNSHQHFQQVFQHALSPAISAILAVFHFFVKSKTNINNKIETINCLHNSALLERVVYSAANNDMVNELNSHYI